MYNITDDIFQTIPVAMAGLRNTHGICPPEVIRFLLDLFKYNDNSKNRYSDNYYRASLVEALGATVTPVISVVQQGYAIIILYIATFTHISSINQTCLPMQKNLKCNFKIIFFCSWLLITCNISKFFGSHSSFL
jgi:transcription initiation factor TFIID subunit 2